MSKRFTYVLCALVLLVMFAFLAIPAEISFKISVEDAVVQAGKDECPAGQEKKDGCVLKYKYVPGQGCISKWFPAGAKAEGWSDSCPESSEPTATAPVPVDPTVTAMPTLEPTAKPIEPTATPVRIQPTATPNTFSGNPEGDLVADEACPSNGDCLCRIASALETQTALMATQTSLMATQTAQQAVCIPPSDNTNTGMNHSGVDLASLSDELAPYLQDVERFLSTPLGIALVVVALVSIVALAFYLDYKESQSASRKKDKVINQ